jgi:hypothetical protein
MEKCIFDRDTLFSFFIVADKDLSVKLKELNKAGKLKSEEMIAIIDQVLGVYHYAAELPIFNLANSEYRQKHAVVERIVILSESDFYSKWTLPFFFPFDMDLAMVNQVMHTFTK